MAEELHNVSRACKVMGVSRDTFYRYQELVNEGGVNALINKTKRVSNLKNRVDQATEQAVTEMAIEFPAYGQLRVSNELRKRGTFVSGSGVRSIWVRNNLENFRKRLKALEERVARDGIILSDDQVAALERKQQDDVACGEIETEHPGYLGSQDTFYVGNLKGVGRIYQQTYVDTYSKIAHCKLYTTKTPITAADLLNDKVLPFYEQHGLPVLRILTDRGTEYCADGSIITTISCIWQSMTSTTQKPRPCRHRPMAFVSASIKRFCRSSTRSHLEKCSTVIWSLCRKIWTFGSIFITMNELIKARCAAAERQCRPCLRVRRFGNRRM